MSRSGIALNTPSVFKPGEEVQIVVFLPDPDFSIRAIGTIVWDDKHGKSGISFKCTSPQHQKDLDGWLDAQLAIVLGSGRPDQDVST